MFPYRKILELYDEEVSLRSIAMMTQHQTMEIPHRKESKGNKADYVTREAVFRLFWFNEPLDRAHHDYLFQDYPILYDIKRCVQSF